jgi:hypothetical protein
MNFQSAYFAVEFECQLGGYRIPWNGCDNSVLTNLFLSASG